MSLTENDIKTYLKTLSNQKLKELISTIKEHLDVNKITRIVCEDGYYVTFDYDQIPDGYDVHRFELPIKIYTNCQDPDSDDDWKIEGIKFDDTEKWYNHLDIEETFPSHDAEFNYDHDKSQWRYGDWDDPIEADGTITAYMITKRLSKPLPIGQYYVIDIENETIKTLFADQITLLDGQIIIPHKDVMSESDDKNP